MGTNAIHENMWEDFASLTYKELDSVARIRYRDPFSGAEKSFEAPSGGPGFYRVPTLIGAWATAPYLHNNALGNFNNDPSVAGRVASFEDAIEKLLWPEKRLNGHDRATDTTQDDVPAEQMMRDGGLVWRTSSDTWLMLYGHQIPSLLAGLTGWSAFWVGVLAWLPTFAFLLLGLGLLLAPAIDTWKKRIAPSLRGVVSHLRWVIGLVSILLAVLAAWAVFRRLELLEAFELASGWRFPWLRIQAFLPAIFLLLIGILALSGKILVPALSNRIALWAGLASLIAAVVVTLGLGRFLAGMGGDLRFGPLPAGMPVNVIANMSPDVPLRERLAALDELTTFVRDWHQSPSHDKPAIREFEQQVAPELMAVSKCPDFVLDRGHDYVFIRNLSDAEKRSLIQLIKTF
jgi:hypothetical protein